MVITISIWDVVFLIVMMLLMIVAIGMMAWECLKEKLKNKRSDEG